MNRTDFVKKVAERSGKTQGVTVDVINAMTEVVIEECRDNDESINLTGFGVFKRKHTAEHVGRNPMTGESMKVAASDTISFKPSPTIKK